MCLEVEVWLEVEVRLAPISFEGLDWFNVGQTIMSLKID